METTSCKRSLSMMFIWEPLCSKWHDGHIRQSCADMMERRRLDNRREWSKVVKFNLIYYKLSS